MRRFKESAHARAVLALAALLLSYAPLYGQNAVVSGRVLDTSNAVVPGAAIELRNTATNVKFETRTNADGIYVFPPVIPGPYELTAGAPGFSTARMTGMTLEVGQSRTVDLTLTPSAVQQSVTVNEEAPLLTVDRADRGTVVENQFIANVPVSPRRNPILLMTMAAGVVPGNVLIAGDNVASEAQTNEFRINGGRSTSNEILIDGAANTVTYNNQFAAIPQLDAIREFKVNTNPYDASLGRTGGGVVSYTIKSGTNEFHGALQEFLQNQILDANGFNANRAGQPRSALRKNQFGFTLGGPVWLPKLYNGRNRTFFFVGYEGLRQNQFFSFVGTVPTALERQGDFSQTTDTNGARTVIYNPYTTRLDPNAPAGVTRYLRDPFPGNVIPANLLNSVGKNFTSFWPLPNAAGVGLSHLNNYISSSSALVNEDRVDARIDHQFSERHTMFARGDWFEAVHAQPLVYGNPESPVQTPELIPGENWIVNDTWAFTPHLIFVHHFSMAVSQTNRSPLTAGFDLTSLGFPSSITNGMLITQFPGVSVGGYSGLSVGPYSNEAIARTYQYAADVTMLHGSHTMKAGFDFRMYTLYWKTINPMTVSATGSFSAGPDPKAATGNTGLGVADLLLGAASVSYPINPIYHNHHPYYAGYFQDEWHASDRLTFTFGIRYNLELPSIESKNQYVYLDLTSPSPLQIPGYNLTGGVGFTGVNGVGRRAQLADTNNWDPRAGLAYRLDKKAVLRAGFGMFHDPYLSTSEDVSQGFNRTTSNLVTQADTVTPLFNLANPFPDGLLQPTGNSLGLATLLGQSISGPIRQNRMAYQSQWSLDIQRQLPYSIVLEAGYTGTASVALPYAAAFNQLEPATLALGSQLTKTVTNPFYGYITDTTSPLSLPTVAYSQLLRPHPQFMNMNDSIVPAGHASYHALEVKVERRFAQGLALLFNYTRSKAIDNVGEIAGSFGQASGFNNSFCYSCDRALSYLDVPNYVNLTVRYELPFGVGKPMLNHGLAAKVFGSWSLAGIYTNASGTPVIVTSPNNSNSYNLGIQRPMATGQSAALAGGPKICDNCQYFNPAAFYQTPAFQFGNVSRELPDVRIPSTVNVDGLIEKQIVLRERLKLEFRAELYNALNSVVFGGPQTSITSSAFGTIALTQTNAPRVIQFAVRLSF